MRRRTDAIDQTRPFTSARHPAVGAVVVVHGLNTRPAVMDDLIGALAGGGVHALRVTLDRAASHGQDPRSIAEGWHREVSRARTELQARFPDLPIHLLGFSLGALVALRSMDADPPGRGTAVLIAPPVALTRAASAIRLLTPLARTGLALPSAAPAGVRARRMTPLSEYAALLRTADGLRQLRDPAALDRARALVLLDRADELVDHDGVREWVRANGLRSWTVTTLPPRRPTRPGSGHLVVSPRWAGAPTWTALTRAVVAHLQG